MNFRKAALVITLHFLFLVFEWRHLPIYGVAIEFDRDFTQLTCEVSMLIEIPYNLRVEFRKPSRFVTLVGSLVQCRFSDAMLPDGPSIVPIE